MFATKVYYVGVMRFAFHVLRLLPIRFHTTQLAWLHYQIYDEASATKDKIEIEIWTYPDVGMVNESACLLISWQNLQVHLIVFH